MLNRYNLIGTFSSLANWSKMHRGLNSYGEWYSYVVVTELEEVILGPPYNKCYYDCSVWRPNE